MSNTIDETLERDLAQAEETELQEPSAELKPVHELIDQTDSKVLKVVAGEAPAELNIPVVTKDVAQRLNIGLMYENIRILLELERQKQKISLLESRIYTKDGIQVSKETLALYQFEHNLYMQKVEYVRKYVLNNKAAMDDLTAEMNELTKLFTSLSPEQVGKLKAFLTELTSEATVPETDILSED